MADPAEVSKFVIHVVAQKAKLCAELIDEHSNLEALGIESLDAIEIVFELEDHFNIDIPYNANSSEDGKLATVADIIAKVEELVCNG
jgi:acyl carrier protein